MPFEVIPGITSAIAAPAYAGVPVTHRGIASSFAVVTGHEDEDKADSTVDWRKMVTAVDTIVVLMGAEVNAEMEHQTARDTTTGEPRPMGERGAEMADTVGKRAS